jgi:MFS family permease
MNFLPIWMGVLVDHLSTSGATAGWMGTAEMSAMALGSIAVSSGVSRIDRMQTAYLGMATVALCNVLAATTSHIPLLFVLRAFAGVGEGCLMALAAAGVGAALQPERAMSVILIILNLSMALLFLAAPVVINAYGSAGLSGLMALLTLSAAPLARWLPKSAPAASQPVASPAQLSFSIRRNLPAVVGLGSIVLLLVAHGMVFAFVERIGTALALTLQQIGSVLSASMLIDCMAPLLVIALGLRWGRVAPIGIGLVALTVATLAVTQSPFPVIFVGGVWLQLFAYTFILPFFAGLLASLDPHGRVAAGMSAAIIVGFMIAPAIGGMLLARVGTFRLMGWTAVGLYLTILTLLAFSAVRERSFIAQAQS